MQRCQHLSYSDFMFKHGFNRTAAVIAILFSLTSWCTFKYCYPDASFINDDSYVYLHAARENLRIDFYPVGYPRFLRLCSVVTTSDDMLVSFQYFLQQISIYILLSSVFYFYVFPGWIRTTLMVVSLGNPAFLFLANYVSSDSLFFSLSVCWLTTLVWLLKRPSIGLLVVHALLLILTFSVRFNALWYPIISSIAFCFIPQKKTLKILGLICLILPVCLIYLDNVHRYKRLTGYMQFTPFSGWQLANNALCAYRFVDPASRKKLPERFHELDSTVWQYFQATQHYRIDPNEMFRNSTLYMWSRTSPLTRYMRKQFPNDTSYLGFTRWAKIAPLYQDYGQTLILNYPTAYLRYYLFTNFLKYYAPPVEYLGVYSTGLNTIAPIAVEWFRAPTNRLHTRVHTYQVTIFNYYPVIAAVLNVMFVLLSILFLKDGIKERNFLKPWMLFAGIWLFNFLFSVLAAPIALRFQLFPLLCVLIADSYLLIELLFPDPGRKTAHIKPEHEQ